MADSKKRITTRKNSGGTKSSGRGRKSQSKGAQNRQAEEQDMGFMRAEVIIICSFAVAVLLFLSNFRLCGAVGEVLRSFQLGTFGTVGFLLPLLIFIGTCFHMSNRGNMYAALKLGAVILTAVAVCGLLQLLFGTVPEGAEWMDYYNQSSASGRGGGLLGGILTSLLILALGRAGAYVILLVVLILSIVCITEKSLVSALRAGGGKAYHYAREDMDRRREEHQRRVQEQRRNASEQKVRGVNLDAIRLTDPTDLPDIMSEQEQKKEEADLAKKQESLEKPEKEEQTEVPPNVFLGKIQLPPDYEEEEETAQKQEEPEQEPADSYLLHNEDGDAFQIPKTHRTLREMDLLGQNEKTDEPKAEREYKEAENDSAPWDEGTGPLEKEEPAASLYIEPEEEPEPETGINYDSFFIPEEPKRVVTASGKVMETETELLQKKIEKRKQEAAQTDVNLQVAAEVQKKKEEVKREYVFPPTSLLKKGHRNGGTSQEEYKAIAIKLQQTLHNFGVGVTVTNISCGPAVTRYELLPEQGVKVSRIVGLADDIKLSLAAADIRIEAPIPGKSAVGIEVPNKENNVVYLRELLESDAFKNHKSRLAFAVGKDIGGQVVVTDVAKMPHLLIAGATGSGKSVCINTLIMSLIYKSKPEDVKLIMVDPKVVELSVYNGIPHLLIPVVTDPKKASGALNWAVAEMEDRYKKFAACNVRDLKGYNERIEKLKDIEDENKPEKLPQIVIIIDELADLMMVAPGEVEGSICRLAQLARAAGIHLVIATQRPSVNVITGLIKANVPSRIAFSVSSGVDSRTIIDMNGAEKLLGKGDMLFYPAGFPKPQRVQGAFVSDEEVGNVVDFLKEQGMTAQYSPEIETSIEAGPAGEAGGGSGQKRDEYFVQAGKLITDKEKASIGMLQRMFKIGFNRAARIMDQLAAAGVVGEEEGTKPRKVLMTPEEFEEFLKQ